MGRMCLPATPPTAASLATLTRAVAAARRRARQRSRAVLRQRGRAARGRRDRPPLRPRVSLSIYLSAPSLAPRHTVQEGRPGARGSPEQERRQGARRGSVSEVVEGQKRRVRLWRSTGGGSWPYMCTAAPLGYTPYLAADPLTPGLIRDVPKELAPCTWVITSPQGTDIYLFLQPYTVVLSAHFVLTTPLSQFVRKHICHFSSARCLEISLS